MKLAGQRRRCSPEKIAHMTDCLYERDAASRAADSTRHMPSFRDPRLREDLTGQAVSPEAATAVALAHRSIMTYLQSLST